MIILLKILVTSLAVSALSGCGIFTRHADDKNPLLTTECPADLPPLKDDATFGDSNLKIIEIAGIYHACRQAAVTGVKK